MAVLLTHPAPYRNAVLKLLKADARFEVESPSIFPCDFGHREMGLGEDCDAIAADVPTLHPGFFDGLVVAWRLIRRFVGRGYDFVVWPAYAPWWLSLPVVLRAALGGRSAVALDTVRESGGFFSRFVKSWLFHKAEFLWVPGLASRRYLVGSCDIPDKKIVGGLYIPEFVPRANLREKKDGDAPVFLMVANNLPFRRMDVVADGFGRYLSEGGWGRLVLCGKGTSALVGKGVEAIEGVPIHGLADLYAGADVYVHNGAEQFSVALLMGAMSGLPLLVGAEVGAAADLLRDSGGAGTKVEDWRDPEAWAAAFHTMVSRASSWPTMSESSLRLASGFDPVRTAYEVASLVVRANEPHAEGE